MMSFGHWLLLVAWACAWQFLAWRALRWIDRRRWTRRRRTNPAQRWLCGHGWHRWCTIRTEHSWLPNGDVASTEMDRCSRCRADRVIMKGGGASQAKTWAA